MHGILFYDFCKTKSLLDTNLNWKIFFALSKYVHICIVTKFMCLKILYKKIYKMKDKTDRFYKYEYFQAEARAEFAERSVQKLQKEVDRLEGMYQLN